MKNRRGLITCMLTWLQVVPLIRFLTFKYLGILKSCLALCIVFPECGISSGALHLASAG